MFKPGDLVQEITPYWTKGSQGRIIKVEEKYITNQLKWMCLCQFRDQDDNCWISDVSIWIPAKELKIHTQQIRNNHIEEILNNTI